ncbi:MAG: hypothetical protein ABSC25_27705, partial [Roseiarcus sp.]
MRKVDTILGIDRLEPHAIGGQQHSPKTICHDGVDVVTLSVEERKGPAALEISSGRDRFAPRPHRRGAEGAMRLG